MGDALDRLTTDLAWLTLALAGIVFLAVQTLLLASALRTPRTAPPEPRAPNAPRYRLSRGWEVVWTLLPALGLLLLGILGAQALRTGPSGHPTATPAPPASERSGAVPAATLPRLGVSAAAPALLSSAYRADGAWRLGRAPGRHLLRGGGSRTAGLEPRAS